MSKSGEPYPKPFEHIQPSKDALLDLAFQQVDDSMLREIALADYGADAAAHLQALLAIKHGQVPAPMKWEPREVLELTRYSEPEDPTSKHESDGKRKHWMRLLSCAILIRAASEPENFGYFIAEDYTIIQLVDSALKLGPTTSLAALQFLCWCIEYRNLDDWNQDRPYFAVAIMLLAVLLDKCDLKTAQYLIAAAHSEVIALTQLFNSSHLPEKWKDLTRRVLCDPAQPDEELQRFGALLLSDIYSRK
jgi:hypothetical protein